ncbi:hypothetical protein B0I08_10935 [Glaciihabitans tibetensis]|uniref:Concanavalin A-like lectin/glucanase superfamily protein n=1 Tax=Glaciihabitans tibetensis TaxID=1266600 RepID=A0A2T0V702_9MICO|nr:DUF6081 family protein [Glaciihabitans tibetensis]PRY65887.1 hypothetical protein B0I08_10935 [Glaciihabitans tibetensis]
MTDHSPTSTHTIYDPMVGPDLDASLWEPLNIGTGPLVEAGATTTVEAGAVTLRIPELANASDSNQAIDNSKHVILSTRAFAIPSDGVGRFAVDMHVDDAGDGDGGDYRYGVASFNVLDISTGAVFNIFSTGQRFLAQHEALAYPGVDHPFTRVIDDALFAARGDSIPASAYRECEVVIDRAAGSVTWTIDGRILHEAHGLTDLPAEIHIGLGVFTIIPVGSGTGSLHGQGVDATWKNFRVAISS